MRIYCYYQRHNQESWDFKDGNRRFGYNSDDQFVSASVYNKSYYAYIHDQTNCKADCNKYARDSSCHSYIPSQRNYVK